MGGSRRYPILRQESRDPMLVLVFEELFVALKYHNPQLDPLFQLPDTLATWNHHKPEGALMVQPCVCI